MKNKYTLILPAVIALVILSSYSGNNTRYPNGAPAGYSGSPADGKNCTSCHNGTASQVDNWITSDVGPDGYLPGQTYTITVTITGSGNKGFEVSPQNPAGDFLGTLTAGSGCKMVGNNHYMTHTSSSNSNPKVWTFQWIAPSAGSGEVTMYGAFALNKSVTKLSTLIIPENTATVVPELAKNTVEGIFPNPADNMITINLQKPVSENVKANLVSAGSGLSYYVPVANHRDDGRILELEVSNVPAGMYIVLLDDGSSMTESKILVSHR